MHWFFSVAWYLIMRQHCNKNAHILFIYGESYSIFPLNDSATHKLGVTIYCLFDLLNGIWQQPLLCNIFGQSGLTNDRKSSQECIWMVTQSCLISVTTYEVLLFACWWKHDADLQQRGLPLWWLYYVARACADVWPWLLCSCDLFLWPFSCTKQRIMWAVPAVLFDVTSCRLSRGTTSNWDAFCSSEQFILQLSSFCDCLTEQVALLPMQGLSLFLLKVNGCVGELLIDRLMLSQTELSGQIFVQHYAARAAFPRTPQLFIYSGSRTCLIMLILTLTCQKLMKNLAFPMYFCAGSWSLLQIKQLESITTPS